MILLEAGYSGVVILILAIVFAPPALLCIIGGLLYKKGHKEGAKICFILAVLYIVIGLGYCFGGF